MKLFTFIFSLLISLTTFANQTSQIKLDTISYQNKNLEYAYYIPQNLTIPSPVLVLVNGLNGKGKDMITPEWKSLSERKGWPIVAPSFVFEGGNAFQNGTSYQYPRFWSGKALQAALKKIKQYNVRISGLYLMGFSAGAQFVERYTLAWPKQVKKCAIYASGGNDPITNHLSTQFFYGIGMQDQSNRQQFANLFKEQAKKYHIRLQFKKYPNTGHVLTQNVREDIIQFFEE